MATPPRTPFSADLGVDSMLRAMARNSLRVLCLSVAAWGLLTIPSAHAATSTLGQLGNNSPCGGFGYSEVETGVGGAPGYVAPSDGMLTSRSILGNADTNDVFKMRVFRPTSTPGQFEVVADSTEQGPLTPSVVNGPFPTNIPVKAGDLLGLNVVAGTAPPCDFSTASSDDVMQEFNPDTASVGQTETSTNSFIGPGQCVSHLHAAAGHLLAQPIIGTPYRRHTGDDHGPRLHRRHRRQLRKHARGQLHDQLRWPDHRSRPLGGAWDGRCRGQHAGW
jgi:hypothetical protein